MLMYVSVTYLLHVLFLFSLYAPIISVSHKDALMSFV